MRTPPSHSAPAAMIFCRFGLLLALPVCWCGLSLAQQGARMRKSARVSKTGSEAAAATIGGQREFETRCSACHGLDGRGGERAPNISTDPAIQQLHDGELFKIVHDGIPTKGMPGFDYLRDDEIKSIVRYLRILGGQSDTQPLRGNPVRGEDLFFGKAQCGNCHMMHGKGGFLGSDLTEYGKTHAPRVIREAILSAAKFRGQSVEMVEIVTRTGERLSGVIRNQDNFSLQLLGADGAFHMLMKSEIERLNRSDNPMMHGEYGQRLSDGELEDLVSYVGQGAREPTPKSAGTIRDRQPKPAPIGNPHE